MANDAKPMHRRNFFLSDVIYDALVAKAQKSGTTMSEHLRAALIQYLKIDDGDQEQTEGEAAGQA
jgi:hypothetical protein